MRIRLEIGTKEISLDVYHDGDEDQISWPVVLDELVWPALRAWGFILDDEFTSKIDEYHREYLEEKFKKTRR